MSFLSELFGGGGGEGPGEAQWRAYNAEVKRLQDEFYATEAQKERDRLAAVDAANAKAIGGASATAPGGASASARLSALLPSGFESTYLPSTLTDPFEESAFTSGRGKAEDVINNLFRRGALTSSGRTQGLSALGEQDAGVRSRLNDIGNVLLENERANLRGIAGSAPTTGDFDPSTYVNQVAGAANTFKSGLGGAYTAALPAGDLFNISGLPTQAGAVSGTQVTPALDPYAAEGGKLSTGLEDTTAPAASKKRTTSVF